MQTYLPLVLQIHHASFSCSFHNSSIKTNQKIKLSIKLISNQILTCHPEHVLVWSPVKGGRIDWLLAKKKLPSQIMLSSYFEKSTTQQTPNQWDIAYEDVRLPLNRYSLTLKFWIMWKKNDEVAKKGIQADYHHKSNSKHPSQKNKKVIWTIPTWETRCDWSTYQK